MKAATAAVSLLGKFKIVASFYFEIWRRDLCDLCPKEFHKVPDLQWKSKT